MKRWLTVGIVCFLGTIVLAGYSPSLCLNMDWPIFKASFGYAGIYCMLWALWITCGIYVLSVYDQAEPLILIRMSMIKWRILMAASSLLWAMICACFALAETGWTPVSIFCRISDVLLLFPALWLLLVLKSSWRFPAVLLASICCSLSLHSWIIGML